MVWQKDEVETHPIAPYATTLACLSLVPPLDFSFTHTHIPILQNRMAKK